MTLGRHGTHLAGECCVLAFGCIAHIINPRRYFGHSWLLGWLFWLHVAMTSKMVLGHESPPK